MSKIIGISASFALGAFSAYEFMPITAMEIHFAEGGAISHPYPIIITDIVLLLLCVPSGYFIFKWLKSRR